MGGYWGPQIKKDFVHRSASGRTGFHRLAQIRQWADRLELVRLKADYLRPQIEIVLVHDPSADGLH